MSNARQFALFVSGFLVVVAAASLGQGKTDGIGPLDVGRIRELHHLTDVFGDRLWPGFDARKVPVAVNHEDRQEMLVGHPRPPAEFHPFGDHELDGEPVMIRDGCTRYGPKGGGWAADVAGEHSAYVGTLRGGGGTTEGYLSLILHECFHVYQTRYRERGEGRWGELPEDDSDYAALLGLEGRVLYAAVTERREEQARELARMFVAVRRERRAPLSEDVVRAEGEAEYNEGTATYIQARLLQLLAESKDFRPARPGSDPEYRGFPDAKAELKSFLHRILPIEARPITFSWAEYNVGMAQGLLLDRFRPDWKKEMREKGMTQFTLVEREFPVAANAGKLAAAAKERFDHAGLLASQKNHIDARLETIRGYLFAQGRRYRIHHGDLSGSFNWKPRGPVFRVPGSIMKKHATIWAGGMRFERGELVLDTRNVPILYRTDYLEWIDREPAEDGSDLRLRSDREEGGVHHGLRVETDGFTLSVPRARVRVTDSVVDIHPLG